MSVLSPAEERLRGYLLQPLLSALSLLEQQGIVHRDISPKNILVHRGRVMLSDLGMAVRTLPLGVHQPPHTEGRGHTEVPLLGTGNAAGHQSQIRAAEGHEPQGPAPQPQPQADACSSTGACAASSSGSSCSSSSLCSTLGGGSGCSSSSSCGCSSVSASAFTQATHQLLPPHPVPPNLLEQQPLPQQEPQVHQRQHQQPLLPQKQEIHHHHLQQQQRQQPLLLQERRAASQDLCPLLEQRAHCHQQPSTHAALVARNHIAPPLLHRTRSSPELMSSVSGTPLYAAPEVLQAVFSNQRVEDMISPKNDVWALGVIAMEALTGRHPFSQGGINGGVWKQDPNILFSISSGQPLQLPPQLSPACADLLTRMLQRDPSSRPYASELLHHPFFSCQAGTGAQSEINEVLAATPCAPQRSRAHAQKHGQLPPLPPTQVAQ